MRYRRFIRTSPFLLAVVALGALASAAPATLAKLPRPYISRSLTARIHTTSQPRRHLADRCISPRNAPANSASSLLRPARSRKSHSARALRRMA